MKAEMINEKTQADLTKVQNETKLISAATQKKFDVLQEYRKIYEDTISQPNMPEDKKNSSRRSWMRSDRILHNICLR